MASKTEMQAFTLTDNFRFPFKMRTMYLTSNADRQSTLTYIWNTVDTWYSTQTDYNSNHYKAEYESNPLKQAN